MGIMHNNYFVQSLAGEIRLFARKLPVWLEMALDQIPENIKTPKLKGEWMNTSWSREMYASEIIEHFIPLERFNIVREKSINVTLHHKTTKKSPDLDF